MNWQAEDDRLKRLSELGDPLEKIGKSIEWELFRPVLSSALQKEAKGPGGRPPWDYVLMFKIMMLQQWNNIADDRTEYLINDRLSYQRFLGLSLGDRVPDAKTLWLFREKLKEADAEKALFELFKGQLESKGLITHAGSIIDATFVDVPRPRNTREENQAIRKGEVPEEWQKPENKAKLEQKDTDARWAKKNGETHCGYKDHVKVDADSKLIVTSVVSDAAEHDSQAMEELLDDNDQAAYADSAYIGKAMHKRIRRKHPKLALNVMERASRNHPLTAEQISSNKVKSRVRVRVEHVFGHMTNAMGGLFIRSIGYPRASFSITMKNLAYNLHRFTYLVGLEPQATAI